MKLHEQVVLVTGASGQVGWGAALAAREAGAHVVLPTRTDASAASLIEAMPDATVVVADVGDHQQVQPLIDRLTQLGRLDHVIAPIGSWWQRGDTLDQPTSELDELLTTYVSAQHHLLRITRPFLEASAGSYTLVTGAAGETHIPGAGMLVVAVRAQYALCDVLRNELASAPFRFNEFRITARVERDARPGVITSRTAGDAFVDLITSTQRSSLVNYPS